MFTQQQAGILLEALDLWIKQNGVRGVSAAHEIMMRFQQIQMQQQPQMQAPARNGSFIPPSAPSQPALPEG